MRWIHNNWRASRNPTRQPANFVVKRTDVLWKTRQDEVWTEIADILGIDTADTNTPNWFNNRMVAIGNIIGRMTDAELAQLDKEVARIGNEGYSEEEKRKYVAYRFQ